MFLKSLQLAHVMWLSMGRGRCFPLPLDFRCLAHALATGFHRFLARFSGEWCRMNIPIPKEIVCDSSKALLTAIVRAFTGFLTIEDYANALIHLKLQCYVRLDVAHFIKMYVNFLKDIKSKAVKALYLSCIGQMILCEDVETAADILLSILIIARCKTNGKLINGQDTQCTTRKKKLKQFLDPKNDELEGNSDMNVGDRVGDTIFDSTEYHNEWSKWARDIDLQAKNIATTENVDDDNAHYFPELAYRLISDMKWLPLWSSIYRNRFGFGRHPATSAPSEIEFNLVKNHVFKLFPKPVRADVFVENYMKYLSGKIKMIDASTKLLKDDICLNKQHELKEQPQCIEEKMHILKDITNKRVCDDYKSNRQTNDEAISASISALQEIENWRGLASDRVKTKSRYLQRNPETYDKIMLPSENGKLTKIPILKNGNNPYLQAVKFKDNEYSFTNTCAFDSLVQIFLVGVCDNPHLRELFMGLKESMKFAELVIYIRNKGVGQHAYRLRAYILIDLFKTTTNTSLMLNKHIVNCESNVVTLICNIFGEFPSIQESTSCSEGCPPKIRNVRVVSVDPSFMTTSTFQNILSELVSVEPRPCSRKEGCSGTAQTTLANTGRRRFLYHHKYPPPWALSLLLLVSSLFSIVDACSSRTTPKPRPPAPTPRPNITFHTYECPPTYAAYYCLNGATCFTVKIGDSLMYNCECAESYVGPRCEYKDLDGSYLPSQRRFMLEKASIAGGATIAVFSVVILCVVVYLHYKRRLKANRAGSDCVDSGASSSAPSAKTPTFGTRWRTCPQADAPVAVLSVGVGASQQDRGDMKRGGKAELHQVTTLLPPSPVDHHEP